MRLHVGLENNASATGPKCRLDHRSVCEAGEEYHLRIQGSELEQCAHLQAVENRHCDIQHQQIGLEFERKAHGFSPVGRRANDCEVRPEEACDRFHNLIVVVS